MVRKISMISAMTVLGFATVIMAGVPTAHAQQTPQQTNPITWQGQFFLTTVTAPCQASNWNADNFANMVYRPKFSSSTYTHNTAAEGLSIITGRAAIGMISSASNGLLRGTSVPVTASAVTGRANLPSWPSKSYPTASTITLTTTPATIMPTTPYINVAGTITTFDNIASCTITFQGSLTQRPD